MQFIPVSPADIPNIRDSRRGRVSYPILKSFLETNMPVAQLDRTGIQQSLMSLTSSLSAYIRNHQLPIKIFTRKNQVYLVRLDLDMDGNKIDWRPEIKQVEHINPAEAVPITAEHVQARFREEIGKTTK